MEQRSMGEKRILHRWVVPTLLASLVAAGCSGKDGKNGQPGTSPVTPTSDKLEPADNAPGIQVQILGLGGATGAGGNFMVGNRLSVTFSVKKDDGTNWDLSELDRGRIMGSGPTFNYQRILAEQSDLLTASTTNPDGSHTYTFAAPIPATYLPPLNDTLSFGALDGELSGQALLSGTYTVGMYLGWDYTVDGESFRDQGDATLDFLLGSGATFASREVIERDNCNQCHTELQAHGGLRRATTLCLLCHTAGAEDKNVASVAGGTPGRSIEFAVMVHKIHSGEHLPSVLGVGVNPDGSRNYAATPMPYQLVGFQNSIADFSEVPFPVWPNLTVPMPRDQGYTALTSGQKAVEDTIRSGVTKCSVCHGDPDDMGPLTAPAQGNLAYSQPARATCGACHDDIDWALPYQANSMTMPAQNDDSACTLCHSPAGDALAVQDAHLHPLLDPAFNPGLNFEILVVEESGTNDGDGTIDPGEGLRMTFTLTDDAGLDVAPTSVSGINVAISGPSSNLNLVHFISVPRPYLTGSQPFDVAIPERVWFEPVGTASIGPDAFMTSRAPHWNVTGGATEVRVGTLTGGGGSSTLAGASTFGQNYLDVVSSTNFARDDYLVVERAMAGEEYLRIQYVEGNRLWFSSPTSASYAPGPVFEHSSGATVEAVTLSLLVENTDYSLDAPTGTLTELTDFGTGNAVVVTYVTDFVMPERYPAPINGSPDLGEEWGDWSGKSLADGTYSLVMYGDRSLTLNLHGESNSYRGAATSVRADFLAGSALSLEPYDLISSGANCYACHQDLLFHGGGRRGIEACVICHGTAGSEDRPQFVAAGAPATTGVTINFRTMLHKIHMGEELANAPSYQVIGFGSAAYPNNYGITTFGEVVFPALPGGTMQCAKCHGSSDVWMEPVPRDHPTEQGRPTLVWGATCGACHEAAATQAHIQINTAASGQESCEVCHSLDDGDLSVPIVHKTR